MWTMARSSGLIYCLIMLMATTLTAVADSTEGATQSNLTTVLLNELSTVALYPLTKVTKGRDVVGYNNDIEFSHENPIWVTGPTGNANTGKSVCTPREWEGIMGIDNHNRALSIKPSMSFFMYLRPDHHAKGPIMEYDIANPPGGPTELPGDWEDYHATPAMYFMIHYNNPHALFFNLWFSNPQPRFSSVLGLFAGVWQHVGFTFDDKSKKFNFWIDGKIFSTHNLPNGLDGAMDRDRIRLGYRANYQCLRADMMCVSFHDAALEEDEVATLMEICKEYALAGPSPTTTTTQRYPPSSSAPGTVPLAAWKIALAAGVSLILIWVPRSGLQ